MASTRRIWTALLAASLLPLGVACQGEPGGEAGMEMEEEAPATEEPAGGEMAPAGQTSADLTAMNESGVTGTVNVTPSGDSRTVAVEAQGLPGAGEYASHIHQGECSSPGGVVVPLNSVRGVEGGSGTATSTVSSADLTGGPPYLVMVHGPQGAPIGCADLPELGSGGM